MSATQLAQLLGLDDATVQQQLWPHLASLSSPGEIKDWLLGMLGPGASQDAFAASYLATRFPPAPKLKLSKPKSAPGVWGKTAPGPAAAPAGGSSRAAVSEQDRRELERQFGAGGKVYIKNRDDEVWGGGGKKSRGGSGTATPVPQPVAPPAALPGPGLGVPVRQPTVSTRTPSPAPVQKKGKGKVDGAAVYDAVVDMSEGATKELLEVDRTIRQLTKGAGAPVRSCFCQARLHAIGIHTPSCPSCALVLCTLNSPIAPCPSCAFAPLLPPARLSSLLQTLSLHRSTIISHEATRIQLAREADELERAAIRFPTLGVDQRGMGGVPRGYANIAGAGPDLAEQAELAMERGVSLGGRQFGQREQAEGKVLRLDMKTKKVRVQIKTPVAAAPKQSKEKDADLDFDDGEIAWIDERDDGLGKRAKETPSAPTDRPFLNTTRDAKDRPLWTEEVEIIEDALPAEEELVVELERRVAGAAVPAGKPKSRRKKAAPAEAATAAEVPS